MTLFCQPNSTQIKKFRGTRFTLCTLRSICTTNSRPPFLEPRSWKDIRHRSAVIRRSIPGCHPWTLIHTYKTFIQTAIDHQFICLCTKTLLYWETSPKVEAVSRKMFGPLLPLWRSLRPVNLDLNHLRTLAGYPLWRSKRKFKHPLGKFLFNTIDLTPELEDIPEFTTLYFTR